MLLPLIPGPGGVPEGPGGLESGLGSDPHSATHSLGTFDQSHDFLEPYFSLLLNGNYGSHIVIIITIT